MYSSYLITNLTNSLPSISVIGEPSLAAVLELDNCSVLHRKSPYNGNKSLLHYIFCYIYRQFNFPYLNIKRLEEGLLQIHKIYFFVLILADFLSFILRGIVNTIANLQKSHLNTFVVLGSPTAAKYPSLHFGHFIFSPFRILST